jgi:hypothetical protein
VEDILKEYCRRIEAVIAEHPGQWLWWHRRWRRRPGIDYNANPDQLLGAKDYVTWLREQINDLKSSRETSKVDG